MPCPLCDAIRAGLPVTDDTPLPCRLRPTSHNPLPDDPFHGAVFDLPPGQKEFDPRVVDALSAHLASTTPEERVAAHDPHLRKAYQYVRQRAFGGDVALFNVEEHPLDALTRKD